MSTEHRSKQHGSATIIRWLMLAFVGLSALYSITLTYLGGHVVVGSLMLASATAFIYVYGSTRAVTYRYLFPGLAGMVLFVLLPLVFTVWIGFTNFGARNLLTFERATEVLMSKSYLRGDDRMAFELVRDGDGYRLLLSPEPGATEELPSIFADPDVTPNVTNDVTPDTATQATPQTASGPRLVTERFSFDSAGTTGVINLTAVPLSESGFVAPAPMTMREILPWRRALERLRVRLPSGAVVVKTSLRAFAAQAPLYVATDAGQLVDQQTGARLTPDFETGFYVDDNGDRVTPGFRVTVGFKHFVRIFTDDSFQAPFLRIFLWTVLFATFSVFFALTIGVLLGELLEWPGLRFRGFYRVLLFLPYAVPGFISILVFKGLFNENFGEINLLLDGLFGIKPHWFSDPLLAKIMLLVVNAWLGYPYIMLLWMGLRKSISKDLYEASALAGASPLTNFFKITWPLVKKPLTPMLVSTFAFNFNNFVLISLLTGGRPDFLDTSVPAGTTDILVSYTYRIAFQDSGQNFGLAAAISTVIFLMVAVLSIINLKLTNAADQSAH